MMVKSVDDSDLGCVHGIGPNGLNTIQDQWYFDFAIVGDCAQGCPARTELCVDKVG